MKKGKRDILDIFVYFREKTSIALVPLPRILHERLIIDLF